jgi:methylenetetrahydrofolate reductase (NADPH)
MTYAFGPGLRPSLFADLPGDTKVSFEFFPPKTDEATAQFWATFDALEPLDPSFVSVTYGAGGTTRERTLGAVSALAKRGAPVAAHLTCVSASRDEVDAVADSFWEAGVRHIVALRGDGQEADGSYSAHPQGYANAAELVAGLTKQHPFEISVAAYPEVHPESASAQADIDNLKRKIDAGATRAITQFFFDVERLLRFRDAAAAAGITAEIVPGILPVSNVKQTRKFAAQCGATIPGWMDSLFEGLDSHPGTRQMVAATIAAELCQQLTVEGVRHFHFYTLNRSELSYAVCHLLGLRPAEGIASKEKVA